MTQYNIDVLEKEQERDALLEKKPYPVYSSKAGLKPNYIREVISRLVPLDILFNLKVYLRSFHESSCILKVLRTFRALKTLNNEIDPMPSEVLSEFNLVNLLDVSFLQLIVS